MGRDRDNLLPTRARGPRLWRAALIAALLLPINCYWAADQIYDVIFSLLVPPLFSLIVLATLNLIPRRYCRRFALTSAELAYVYILLSVSTAIAAEWLWAVADTIPHYALFADRTPWDQSHIVPNLPSVFYLTDPAPLKDLQRGGYGLVHFLTRIGIWLRPICAWTVLLGLFASAMLCINALMREQWTRREKLAFPIVQVPMLLMKPESPAWRSPLLWGGLAVMFAIDMVNGVAFYYPSVPTINVRFLAGSIRDVLPWMGDRPWTSIGVVPVGFFPYMAAIGAFMPTDLLFSTVVFFFVRKALQVTMDMYGYEQGLFGGGWLVPSPPYFSEQTWGGVIALFLSMVVACRHYLRELWGHIRSNTAFRPDEVRPRYALFGLLASVGALAALGWSLGLSPAFVLLYVAAFLVFSIVLTRMRAQLGPPIHEMAFFGPHQLMLAFGGGQTVTDSALVKLYHLFFVTNRIHRTHPMPYQLEGFRMGEEVGIAPRRLFWGMLVAVAAGVACGLCAHAYRGYVNGAQPSGEIPGAIRQLTEQRQPSNLSAILAMVSGFAVVFLLDTIRFQAPGFPLHPVGYVLSMNFGVDYCWFGLIVVLLVKYTVQRYWGLRGYEKLRLIAIGVILAEFSAEGIWTVASMVTRTATYSISFYGRAGWLR